MNTERMVKVVGVAVLVLVALLTVAGACTPKAVPTQEATPQEALKEVNITLLTDYTGPTATYAVAESHGIVDAFAWANKNNLIPGVKVVLEDVDTKGLIENCMTAYRNAMSRSESDKPILTHTVGTGYTYGLQPKFIEDDMPNISPTASGRIMLPPMQCFGDCVPYEDQCAIFVDWFVSNWKETRAPRFAFLTCDAAFGRTIVTDKVKAYIKSKGCEIVSEQYVPLAALEANSQILALKNAKVDFAYGIFITAPQVTVCRSWKDMDAKNIVLGASAWSHPHHIIAQCGDAAEGLLITTWFDLPHEWRTNNVVWSAFKDAGRPEIEHDGDWLAGWMEGMMALDGLKKAIADVGIEKVDRHAMYKAMMKVDTTCQGVCHATFTPERHWATDKVGIARLTAKKLVTPEEDSIWAEWILPRDKLAAPSPTLMEPVK